MNPPAPDNWFGFIIQLTTVLSPIALAWIAYKQIKNGQEIKKLEVNTNSMKDQLVKVVGEAEKAKGNLEGRSELAGEQRDAAPNRPQDMVIVGTTVPVPIIDVGPSTVAATDAKAST